jgi:hypothetical protein
MAISVDSVYQKVLALANKEQKGYITPQEFNLLASKAQSDIFETYFHDVGWPNQGTGNSTIYSDTVDFTKEKVSMYERFDRQVIVDGNGIGSLPDSYRLGKLSYDNTSLDATTLSVTGNTITFSENISDLGVVKGHKIFIKSTGEYIGYAVYVYGSLVQTSVTHTLQVGDILTIRASRSDSNSSYRDILPVSQNELNNYMDSSKLKPTLKNPVYVRISGNTVQVYPRSITTGVTCNHIAKPTDPNWTYVVVNDRALYNASDASMRDFDLHASEESTLINSILELVGIVIAKPGLSEVAIRNEQMKVENRK